ncbi:MAG: hypothetical protein K2N35_10325, partial [Muribaculaceae bacterium]|nr:hypothetical protein [Muribaculaceae bacterium]
MKTPLKLALLTLTLSGIALPANADDSREWLLDSVPQQWNYQSAYSQKLPTEDAWWKTFGDATLDSL